MVHSTSAQSPPSEASKRPRGILKNSNSYQQASPADRVSPTFEQNPFPANRPPMPNRELSEKEVVQMNTNINAGIGGHRRNSSNPSRGSISRRQSASDGMQQQDAGSPRLRWDEANLYLNEGQMGGKMKIDEPKTPFAKQYDPLEDEEEMSALNAQDLMVDEVDKKKAGEASSAGNPHRRTKEDEIPGLDLGEPEIGHRMERTPSDGEKRVIVDTESGEAMDVDGARHGEVPVSASEEEREKHRRFEEMRKKHYEMKDVKNLLGHADEIDELEDE